MRGRQHLAVVFATVLSMRQVASLCSSSYVFISSFSSISTPVFCDLINTLSNVKTAQRDLVYVPTATYAFNKDSPKSIGEQRRRSRYDAKQKMKLLSEAFDAPNCIMLELDDPLLDDSKLEKSLQNCGILYVDGGNTFWLQKHIIRSSFWSVAKKHLETNQCVYIGSSAGAIVAGRSIIPAYWKGWDDETVALTDGFKWTEVTHGGGQLVDESFFMHYEEVQHKSLVASREHELIDHKVNLIPNNYAKIYTNFRPPLASPLGPVEGLEGLNYNGLHYVYINYAYNNMPR